MKLRIDYEITEFTAEDAEDSEHTHTMAMNAAAAVYVGLLYAIERERENVETEAVDEARRWGRFIHFCNTGVML